METLLGGIIGLVAAVVGAIVGHGLSARQREYETVRITLIELLPIVRSARNLATTCWVQLSIYEVEEQLPSDSADDIAQGMADFEQSLNDCRSTLDWFEFDRSRPAMVVRYYIRVIEISVAMLREPNRAIAEGRTNTDTVAEIHTQKEELEQAVEKITETMRDYLNDLERPIWSRAHRWGRRKIARAYRWIRRAGRGRSPDSEAASP